MKYRLLDEETLGQMIDFLDSIQIEASKGKYKDDLDKINMCSYLISEIIKDPFILFLSIIIVPPF